jgi:hypothetical protein
MNDSTPRPSRTGPPSNILMELVSAGLFLYIGFGLGLVGISDSALYNGSVTALVWGARVVGIGSLLVILLNLLHVPHVVLFDLLLSGLATAGCAAVGLIWMTHNDMQGILLLLFALLNAGSARSAWYRWCGERVRQAGAVSSHSREP